MSEYQTIYDLVIRENHILRKIAEETDFTFVNKMLEASYCKNFGRPAKEPEYKNKIIRLHQEEECTLKSIQEEYGVSKTS